MLMTDKQKYAAVLEELGEVLTSKNLIISSQEYTIKQLKEKLEAAERERDTIAEQAMSLDEQLRDDENLIVQLRNEIEVLKGGAA